ncbi:MAG: hypothetical protein QNK89_04575 [Lacinutrix sp.]|uniref:hypothetical protein n=1 Tax=Lacinutrix sp. TaxID=1937692 RepID=UPI0030A33668
MAEKVEIEVVAKTSKANKALSDLENKLDGLSKAGQKNREGFKVLDEATGGYAGKIKNLSGSVKGVITGAKGFIKTLKGVKGALISTGIGALVVALGLIVAYWDDIKGLVDGTTRAQREGLAEAEKMKAVAEEQLAITGSMENTLKLQGKTEREIRDLKVQQTNEVIAATEAQLAQQESMKKSQIAAAKRNRNIVAGIIGFITAPITVVLGMVDAITDTLAKIGVIEEGTKLAEGYLLGVAEMVFDPDEVATEADETIKETEDQLRKLKNTRDGFVLKDRADKNSAKEKAKSDREKANKEESDAIKKAEDEKKAALEAIRKGEIDTEAERREEKLRLVEEEYAKLKEAAVLYEQDTVELESARLTKLKELKDGFKEKDRLEEEARKEQEEADKLAEQEALIEQLELDKEFEELNFEEQREVLAEREALLLEDTTLTDEQKINLKEQFAKKEADIDLASKEAKAAVQNATLDVAQKGINVLKQIAGENIAVQKALLIAEGAAGIAKILVNTGVANAKAVSASVTTGGMPWVAINSISAGLGIAGNIAATAKGLSALGGGSPKGGGVAPPKTAGGGGTGVIAETQAPSFNVVGATETSSLADTIASQTSQPVQAYVVSNDVTTAQSLENNIVEGATL